MKWNNFFGVLIGILGTMIIKGLGIDSKYLVIGMLVGIIIYQMIKYFVVYKSVVK